MKVFKILPCLFYLVTLLSLFVSCHQSFDKNELKGTYIGNNAFCNDTIIISDDSLYYHIGLKEVDGSKFSDTGIWTYKDEHNEILFRDFEFYQSLDGGILNCKGNWFSMVYRKDNSLHLNIKRYNYYYKKKQ